jgi:hypothetical protein
MALTGAKDEVKAQATMKESSPSMDSMMRIYESADHIFAHFRPNRHYPVAMKLSPK